MTEYRGKRMPRIGITASFLDYPPVGGYAVGRDYVLSTKMAGGCPLMLPMTTDPEIIGQYVASIDGLLLTGGEDIDPALYGEAPKPGLGRVSHERDAFEFRLLKETVEAGKRVFAICRGLQVVNVVYGGTLVQDIPTEIAGYLPHFGDMAKRSEPLHWVTIEKGTYLNQILSVEKVEVNSFHHQAVKGLAPGFHVSARAQDGVIEAIESPEKGIIAVQFHPENMTVRFPLLLKLFTDLVANSCS